MVSTNRVCCILHRRWRDSVVARVLHMARNLSRRCGPQEHLLCVVETRPNNNRNLDSALAAMSRDVRPERRVEGLTKDQLKARFGSIRTLGEVTPYYQACYFTPGAFTLGNVGRAEILTKSEDAFFLRGSPWMVVMKNGKAVDLVLCKGY